MLYPFEFRFSREGETLKMKVFATHTERVPMKPTINDYFEHQERSDQIRDQIALRNMKQKQTLIVRSPAPTISS